MYFVQQINKPNKQRNTFYQNLLCKCKGPPYLFCFQLTGRHEENCCISFIESFPETNKKKKPQKI